jgi:hypothetical protein
MSECKCGKPTRDGAYFCDNCGNELSKALADIKWLDEELETTVGRQQGIDYRRVGGGKGAKKTTPQPVNWTAAGARSHLRTLLVSWVLFCNDEGIRNQSPHVGLPADNLPAMGAYLLWRVDGLAWHDIGPDAVEELTDAVKQCHRLIDRPADRQFLGTCQQCDEGGNLYAAPGGKIARCDVCDAKAEASVLRAALLAELDDRLCTAAEIAHLSTYLGLKANRDAVRKRVNQWAARGQIVRHPSITDEVTFRFGEVYAKLATSEYAKDGAA